MVANKESLHDDDGDGAECSDTSRIYRIIKDMAEAAVAVGEGARCGSPRAGSDVCRIASSM